MQKAFIAKTSELLAKEEFEEVVKSLESHSEEVAIFEKSFEEEKEEIAKKAEAEKDEKAEEIEKAEKERVEKYAELFANADTVKSLLDDIAWVKEAFSKEQELNKALAERLETVEKMSKGSSQPDEALKKKEKSDAEMWAWFENFL